MAVIERSNVVAGGERKTSYAVFDYDFAIDGGAISTITLRGTAVPSGATVRGGFIEVTTVPVGATATISAGIEAAADLQAAAAISGAPWSTTGRKSVIPAFTGATSIRLTANRNVSIVIGTAALTAGVFRIWVEYIL